MRREELFENNTYYTSKSIVAKIKLTLGFLLAISCLFLWKFETNPEKIQSEIISKRESSIPLETASAVPLLPSPSFVEAPVGVYERLVVANTERVLMFSPDQKLMTLQDAAFNHRGEFQIDGKATNLISLEEGFLYLKTLHGDSSLVFLSNDGKQEDVTNSLVGGMEVVSFFVASEKLFFSTRTGFFVSDGKEVEKIDDVADLLYVGSIDDDHYWQNSNQIFKQVGYDLELFYEDKDFIRHSFVKDEVVWFYKQTPVEWQLYSVTAPQPVYRSVDFFYWNGEERFKEKPQYLVYDQVFSPE